MRKSQRSILVLLAIFVVLLGTTLYVSFSSNLDVQEVVVKSITPVYDETSTVVVDNENVIFNDKNQVVDYKVVIENTQDYDVKITDIKLTTPTEEFLEYKVEGISKEDVLSANSTKELTVSLETTGIEGWGRNFADELTANISFEKVVKQEEVAPPAEDKEDEVEHPKEEVKVPEKPAASTEELISKTEKIEIIKVTKDTIEFKETPKLEKGDKIAVWLYSDPIFLGYFEVVETNGIKQIVGLEEALKEANVKEGEHNIVLVSPANETIGYVEVYVNENNTLSQENPADNGKIENPYTSDKGLIIVLSIATCFTGLAIVMVSKNKFAKYTIMVIMLSSTLTLVNADDISELPITLNVSFESQNVMKPSGCRINFSYDEPIGCVDFWSYVWQIKNIYIQNEIAEIEEYEYEFDVTEGKNDRVKAYLVPSDAGMVCYGGSDSTCYDLYLQADGIIYPNEDASFYFAETRNLDSLVNLAGLDTSNVTNMSGMFANTGWGNVEFTLDVSDLNTSSVEDMSGMFYHTGYCSTNFTLDLSNFDTSKVTDMSEMFSGLGYRSPNFTLDVSNFDTSKVTDMSGMFSFMAWGSEGFTLDLSHFDTSSVINMSNMFTEFSSYSNGNVNVIFTIKNPTSTYDGMFSYIDSDNTMIKLNYIFDTEMLVEKMIDNSASSSNVVKGNLIVDVDNLSTGDEIHISGEKFNVISQTDDTVTMLAQYNLGTDYKQSPTSNKVKFSDREGWEYKPGPKEIDIQKWSTVPKTYVNEYVTYLQSETGDTTLSGNLITLTELKGLGCKIKDDYSYSLGLTCANSIYKSWLINGQHWWTRSAVSTSSGNVWYVRNDGTLSNYVCTSINGVRPVITISKSSI